MCRQKLHHPRWGSPGRTLALCAGEPDLQPWSPPWLTRLKQPKEEISDAAQQPQPHRRRESYLYESYQDIW